MVAPKPFVSDATADRISQLKRRSYATTQKLQDPAATLTFERWNDTTGAWDTVAGPVVPIRIALDRRQDRTDGQNQGLVETVTTGTVRVFAADLVADIQQDDRFSWQGQWCRVTGFPVERNGAVFATFELMVGA